MGGKRASLYEFEKQVLRPWECSDEQLDVAAHDFINEPANVSIEDDSLYLSSIFKWYKKEFPKDIYAYLMQHAEPELGYQLQTAKDNNHRIRYRTYDWSLNDTNNADNTNDDSR